MVDVWKSSELEAGLCSTLTLHVVSFTLLYLSCQGFIVGEVAKLFADAGLICIASLISPYRKDRDACRAMLLPDENFIEARLKTPYYGSYCYNLVNLFYLFYKVKMDFHFTCMMTGFHEHAHRVMRVKGCKRPL